MFSFSYLRHRSGLSRWFKHLKIRHTYENRNVVAVSGAVLKDLSETLALNLRRKAVIHNPLIFLKFSVWRMRPSKCRERITLFMLAASMSTNATTDSYVRSP
jgi:hypothetical protein